MKEVISSLLQRAKTEELKGQFLLDEPLSGHTSYRIGGPADLYVAVWKEEDLLGWIRLARELEVPHFVMGRGTNLLVADEGIRGVVIENRCRGVLIEGEVWRVLAGGSFPALARRTAQEGLAGLEWGTGIPGSVGGAIVNNAGAHGSSVAQVLQSVTILDQKGDVRKMPVEQIRLNYRPSRFRQKRQEVVLSAKFALRPESPALLKERLTSYTKQRGETQPQEPSAGSVFKNPEGDHAGRLIEEVGLKGRRVGDAQISPRHANFIVNLGGAKASDVAALIKLVRERVWQTYGVELELEIELVGKWEAEELATLTQKPSGKAIA